VAGGWATKANRGIGRGTENRELRERNWEVSGWENRVSGSGAPARDGRRGCVTASRGREIGEETGNAREEEPCD